MKYVTLSSFSILSSFTFPFLLYSIKNSYLFHLVMAAWFLQVLLFMKDFYCGVMRCDSNRGVNADGAWRSFQVWKRLRLHHWLTFHLWSLCDSYAAGLKGNMSTTGQKKEQKNMCSVIQRNSLAANSFVAFFMLVDKPERCLFNFITQEWLLLFRLVGKSPYNAPWQLRDEKKITAAND